MSRLEESKRIAPNEQWLRDELFAIKMLSLDSQFLDLLNTGKKYLNDSNSTVAYLLGITDVVPETPPDGLVVDYGRLDFPDIDVDIQDTRRSEVKDYLRRKFKNVAAIRTFRFFSEKGIVRDASRALAVPMGDVNAVLKRVDSFEDFCSSRDDVISEFRRKYPDVERLGERLRGRVQGVGMHAAGMVVSSVPVSEYAPVESHTDTQTGERVSIIGYDMAETENVGFQKIDVLGLKTLSVIKDCIDKIAEFGGRKIELLDIPLDDDNVYKMLSNGFTQGVFQAEAAPYTALLMKMGVSNFNDLSISNALVRPGAMNTIGSEYIARKQGRAHYVSLHPIMDDITSETRGLIVYQEQVMRTCVELAGMSWAEADKIRKIIGKKKDPHEFDQYRSRFIEGASKNVSVQVAEHLWSDFEAHANYSFNKCAYYGTKIQMADGSSATLSELYKRHLSGDQLEVMSMWADGSISPHRVKAVVNTGKKKLYCVKTLSGRSIHVSEDHRLLTNDGYKPVSMMVVGDELVVGPKRVSDQQRAARSKSMREFRASEAGVKQNARAATRMRDYQATLTFEDRSRHQKKISAMGRSNAGVLAAQKAWKDKWENDEQWRISFIENTLAAPRGYKTGSGYGRSSFAKDGKTWCSSVPERELCDWLIDNEIPFEAHKVLPSGRMCDFYVDGLYIEMDGMDRTTEYFSKKYSMHGLPYIVVTPEDYREVLSSVFNVMHVRNGDPIVSIEESGFNRSKNNYTFDIEMEDNGPKNYVTVAGIVSHNSHAVSYSRISYWTAWLKYHYRAFFMWALLMNEKDSTTRTRYLIECKRLGIRVMLPHVMQSQADFDLDDSVMGMAIRMGLGNVKGLTVEKSGAAIVKYRDERRFTDYSSFVNLVEQKGSGLNRGMIKSLNAIGALSFPDNPLQGNESDNYYEYLGIPKFDIDMVPKAILDQVTPVDSIDEKGCYVALAMSTNVKKGKGWSRIDFLDDTGSMGVFHGEDTAIEPGRLYLMLVADNRIARYIEPSDIADNPSHVLIRWLMADELRIADGLKVCLSFQTVQTKARKNMAHVVLSDKNKELTKALVFPSMYPRALGLLFDGRVARVSLGRTDDGTLFIKEIQRV